jgi:hypothetical protein
LHGFVDDRIELPDPEGAPEDEADQAADAYDQATSGASLKQVAELVTRRLREIGLRG